MSKTTIVAGDKGIVRIPKNALKVGDSVQIIVKMSSPPLRQER